MKIRLRIDPERLDFDDLLTLEDAQEGKRPFHTMRDLLARFLVDEQEQFLPEVDAKKLLGKLKAREVNEAIEQLMAQIKELQATAVPPANTSS